jgi:hypothetical protein
MKRALRNVFAVLMLVFGACAITIFSFMSWLTDER